MVSWRTDSWAFAYTLGNEIKVAGSTPLGPAFAVLELDIKNAFNESAREAMLVECMDRLPQLLPLARALYGRVSDLLYRMADDSLHRPRTTALLRRPGTPAAPNSKRTISLD